MDDEVLFYLNRPRRTPWELRWKPKP